ncbi:hypothetical protein INT46_004718 [Mucor plumbeus]|uniref:Ran guanine nucleotide release factor n=1 Tax=Mucor plumbeus TaxID=97098 RepID=A0A8H7V8S6_9FUNG|nr:hypothetical protein INT46_004718 [Mucor plumbeus]
MSTQELFGGAITVPVFNSFVDASPTHLNDSQFRQIPDNQEVFVDMNTQQSLIFELLEQVEATNEQVAEYHFQQLADDNEAAESTIILIDNLKPQDISPLLPQDGTEIYVLQGSQKISKFNENNAFNTVEIVLVVVRLTKVATDFVISVNAPVKLASTSSEQESVNETSAVTIDTVKAEMMAILKGLQVKDWDLFG